MRKAVIVLLAFFLCSQNEADARFFLPDFFGSPDDTVEDSASSEVQGINQQSPAVLARRVQKSTVSEVMGCKKLPPMSVFKQLNSVCEDCFLLFRDQELYHMCRSDCFSSEYFLGCMDYLVFEKENIGKMAKLVNQIHEYV